MRELVLLRQSSGLTEAPPGLNLVGALLTDYSRFYFFFNLCNTLQYSTRLKILKRSLSTQIYPRGQSLHTRKHYESEKRSPWICETASSLFGLCLLYTSHKLKLQAAAFIRAVYTEPRWKTVRLAEGRTRWLLCRKQVPCPSFPTIKLHPRHLLFWAIRTPLQATYKHTTCKLFSAQGILPPRSPSSAGLTD